MDVRIQFIACSSSFESRPKMSWVAASLEAADEVAAIRLADLGDHSALVDDEFRGPR
jgi:hypothetical protein